MVTNGGCRIMQSAMRVACRSEAKGKNPMNSIVYIVGLVVIVIAVLSFFGLR